MDITGLDKAEVLAALYNASFQQGMGRFDARGKEQMTAEHARELLAEGRKHFDYLYGRVMKISLISDELRTYAYDRDNGEGAAEAAIAHLRK